MQPARRGTEPFNLNNRRRMYGSLQRSGRGSTTPDFMAAAGRAKAPPFEERAGCAMTELFYLTSTEEIALRQLASQSTSVAPSSARRLVRLALAEAFRDGWRLTPLGLQHYKALPKPPLLGRQLPPVIDNILNRAIPLALAARITTPERDSDV